MKMRELLGTAQVPGGDELRLYRRGDDFIIAIDRNELMSSRMSGSEEALATMTCERLRSPQAASLLIGGYGMGFTLRAALGVLGPDAKIAVAELVPGIIEWARGPMAELAAGCLDDPRVELVLGDVSKAIGAATRRYDAILLDVDNGPDGLTREANEGLYSAAGLATAKAALRARRNIGDMVRRPRRPLHPPIERSGLSGRRGRRARPQQWQRSAPRDLVRAGALSRGSNRCGNISS